MKKCYECGKELKFWEGYYHPTIGKKEFICSDCFDFVEESMESYSNFILSHVKQYEERHFVSNSIISFRKMVHHFGHKM